MPTKPLTARVLDIASSKTGLTVVVAADKPPAAAAPQRPFMIPPPKPQFETRSFPPPPADRRFVAVNDPPPSMPTVDPVRAAIAAAVANRGNVMPNRQGRRRKHEAEFKAKVVKEALETAASTDPNRRSQARVAADNDISQSLLSKWVLEAKEQAMNIRRIPRKGKKKAQRRILRTNSHTDTNGTLFSAPPPSMRGPIEAPTLRVEGLEDYVARLVRQEIRKALGGGGE